MTARKILNRRNINSALWAVLLTVVIFGLFILLRPVFAQNDFMAKAYTKMGMTSHAPEEVTLEFDRIEVVRTGDAIKATGQIINMAQKPADIKEVVATLIDDKQQSLASQKVTMPKRIEAEQSQTLSAEFNKVPPSAKSVRFEIFH